MTEPTLILVRHAQASLGAADYDRLSPLGHRQAACLAHRLRDRVGAVLVRGEHRRHRQTVAALVEHEIEVDPGLNEYSVQHLLEAAAPAADRLGLRFPPAEARDDPRAYLDAFLALFPAVLDAWQLRRIECPTNGPWAGFRERVDAAGARLSDHAHRHGTVVAFSSAGAISTLISTLLKRDLAWQRALNVALYNASVTELRYRAGAWHLISENCIEHLVDPELRSLA